MGEIGMIFNDILVRPMITVLLAIYHGLVLLHVPYTLGFSIILLTIVIRFLLYPFVHSQLHASHKMQKINPHIAKLKEKHKGDSRRIQEETMKLYKEHGINPVAGCLPLLIQLPLIWALYSVLREVVSANPHTLLNHVNQATYIASLRLMQPWDTSFFGIPLGKTPSVLLASIPLIVLVPLITGALQFVQSKMMFQKPQAPVQKQEKKDKSTEESMSEAFQTQSMYILPIMIGFFSYTFPIGLSLYWNTFTIFGILQQYLLLRTLKKREQTKK